MLSSFLHFYYELSKPKALRKGFIRKRKNLFNIREERINELYDRYFSTLSTKNKSFHFKVASSDLEEVVYLLRVHFRLWIEMEGSRITLYREFPKRFKLIKTVNTENHPYTPTSIQKGTIMELAVDSFGVVNYLNGIPLTGKILSDNKRASNIFNPFLQINYPFIEAIHTLH